jgi:hypothetical protein
MAPKRKGTPDIMAGLLSEPEVKTTSKIVNQNTSKLSGQQATSPAEGEGRVQVGYYLSPEGAEAIEELWYQLRKMAGAGKTQINKSLIVDLGLQIAREELEKEGSSSKIARRALANL